MVEGKTLKTWNCKKFFKSREISLKNCCEFKASRSYSSEMQTRFVYISASFEFIDGSIVHTGVTIHESEEDDFKSEFARNSNPKGFNDTR